VAVNRDFTERKTMEIALRRSEERLRAVLQNMPVMLTALDEQAQFQVWNRECERVTGYRAKEIIGQPQAFETLYPQAETRTEIITAWVRRNHDFRDWETTLTDRQGRPKTVVWSSISQRFPVPGWAVWSIGVDVTERKRAEEALARKAAELERSNQELEQFAYVASHDLQEPLRMVTSYLQLLERRYQDKLDANGHEFIHFAVDGASRMKGLITDLLTYSRAGRQGKPLGPTAVEQVVAYALKNLEIAIEESQAVITHDLLPTIAADEGQLVQLFQNLISNAIKFRGETPPQIHIGVTQQDDRWCFSVRDNGLGIELEQAERVFVIFQRLHGQGEYPGSGIGLAVCKKIVERHGGWIWLESDVGKGSTFYFTMPLVERETVGE
jgi:PAS domain S-box-containing protein